MTVLDGFDMRFSQMTAMFAACGHDLPDALISGRLDGAALRRCVFRCYTCRFKDRCSALLASAPALEAPPSYCANSPVLSRLRLSEHAATAQER